MGYNSFDQRLYVHSENLPCEKFKMFKNCHRQRCENTEIIDTI